jgi:hypothetical protein
VAQKDTIKDLSEDDKFTIQRDMLNVGNLIKDLLGGGERSVLSQIEESILEKKDTLGRQGKESSKLTEMEEKVADLIKSLKRQQKIYNKIGLEVQVDILLDYVTPEIDSLLQNTIDNIKTNRRLISIIKDEKYDTLKKKFQEEELTKEEYENELIELNIEQLENKKLGRETLLNELREAQTDKSGYSVYMDPLMYSTQVTLQLFGSMVKNKLYQASADTREIIDELAPIYREYANYKGSDIDPKKFNSEILETQVYYVDDPKTGFKKRMEILSFVQPYDVTKFHEDEYSMRKTLAEKYEMPKNVDYEVFKEWKKSDKGVSYFREVAKWYNRNTVRTEEGALLKDKLTARLRDVSAKAKLVEGTNPDLYIAYEAQIIDLKSQIGRIYDSVNDQYKGMAVRPNSNYANPKYSQLIDASGNPIGAAGAYYKGFLDVYHRQQRVVGKQTPLKNDWDDVSYVVPSVESQGLEKIQQDNYNVFKSAVHYAKREFSFLETDDSYRMSINANKEQRNKIVPVFYSNPTDAKFVSHDIGSTIVLYAGMANMFKRKSEITGAVIMMRDIVERREVLEVNANNVPFLSAAARKAGVTRHTRRKGEVSNNFQHLSEFIDKIFFGESEIKSSINIGNATISGNKIINKLTTFTALNQLSLNFLQAGNQYLIDNEKLMEEAVAGQFFNAKNLTWAKLTYGKLLLSGDTVKDMGKFSPDTKLSRFIAEFDILGDALNDYKTKKTGNRAFKAMGRDALFFAQHMAEHETAVTRGLAIADSLKGKLKDVNGEVIKNEDGSEANLWDLYKQDEKTGKWDLDSRVANYKKINIINLISGVYKKTNQIKTDFDDPLINRRWWGKALAMYRRYFQPGLRRRFGYGIGTGLHIDTETDTITEGMYTSFVRYMRESISKGFKFGSVYQMLSEDFEKPNVKRTTAEISMLVAVTVIGTILLGMLDDDDEEDDQFATAFFAYQALRMQAELAQFWNPAEFYRFIASPTALSRPIVDAALLIDQLLTEELPYRIKLALDVEMDEEDTKTIYYQKNSNGHLQGDSKTAAMGNKILPISNGLSKSFSPEEALKFFTQ